MSTTSIRGTSCDVAMGQVRRILIIRGSAIGDVLHATPLAAALKSAYPHLEITWITEEICADVVLGNPHLHNVIVIPRSRWKRGRFRSPRIWAEYFAFLQALRARRFDMTLDLQGYAKSALLVLAAGAPHRLGWWRMRDGANFVSQALPRREESRHRVDWFLDVARALGAECNNVQFDLDIPEGARSYIATMLRDAGIDPHKPYAVINQAAGDQARQWNAEGYGRVAWELARHYGLSTVLVGVSKDYGQNETIIANYRSQEPVNVPQEFAERDPACSATGLVHEPINLAGRTDLKQLFALIAGCAIQISGDTGSLHIAVALNRPVIALYGSSDPLHAGPWRQMENVIAHRELCRPECTVRHCAYNSAAQDVSSRSALSSAYCLQSITPDEVMAQVARLLK